MSRTIKNGIRAVRRTSADRRRGLHESEHEWLQRELAADPGYPYECNEPGCPLCCDDEHVDDGPDAIWRVLDWWDEHRPDWVGRPLRVRAVDIDTFR